MGLGRPKLTIPYNQEKMGDISWASDAVLRLPIKTDFFQGMANRRIYIRLKILYTISVVFVSFMQNDK